MSGIIKQLTAKSVSALVIFALVLPYFTLFLAGKAAAQVQTLPSWAVTEFQNMRSPGTKYGTVAAEAVAGELSKTGQFDVQRLDDVDRAVKTLGLTSPLVNVVNLLRVGQELRAQTIVNGEIGDYRIETVGGAKRARVALRVVAYDVVSGLPVNGSVQAGESTLRAGDVSEETLINDAIQAAANSAIREMLTKTLPVATVLNTTASTVFINQGTRSGFAPGMRVIISRGARQVAVGEVRDVEADSSELAITQSFLGMQPGDKVRAVVSPPEFKSLGSVFNSNGNVNVNRRKGGKSNTGLVSVLLVLGVVAVLLSGGNSNETRAARSLDARPTLDETNTPAIRLNWTRDGYAFNGAQNLVTWQIFRSDIPGLPIIAVSGLDTSFTDTTLVKPLFQYGTYNNQVDGTTCDFAAQEEEELDDDQLAAAALAIGRPYTYQIELVYRQRAEDVAGGPPAGGGGGVGGGGIGGGGIGGGGIGGGGIGGGGIGGGGIGGGGIGGGGIGGGGVGGGGVGGGGVGGGGAAGGGAGWCYFKSSRTNSRGVATAIRVPTLTSPTDRAELSDQFSFAWSFLAGTFAIRTEYILQFSSSRSFARNQTYRYPTVFNFGAAAGLQNRTSGLVDLTRLPASLRNASEVFWRVGVRNPDDRPGPLPDAATREPYLFSEARSFVWRNVPNPPL